MNPYTYIHVYIYIVPVYMFMHIHVRVVVQDMSYQCCIEMEGDREDILSSLSPFFCSDAGT